MKRTRISDQFFPDVFVLIVAILFLSMRREGITLDTN